MNQEDFNSDVHLRYIRKQRLLYHSFHALRLDMIIRFGVLQIHIGYDPQSQPNNRLPSFRSASYRSPRFIRDRLSSGHDLEGKTLTKAALYILSILMQPLVYVVSKIASRRGTPYDHLFERL